MDSIDKKFAALKELYPNFVSSLGDDYFDEDGNTIIIDNDNLNTKLAEIDLDELRAERNKKLAETDFYALSDVTMSDEMSTYRQALRDITDTYTSLDDVVWPTKP